MSASSFMAGALAFFAASLFFLIFFLPNGRFTIFVVEEVLTRGALPERAVFAVELHRFALATSHGTRGLGALLAGDGLAVHVFERYVWRAIALPEFPVRPCELTRLAPATEGTVRLDDLARGLFLGYGVAVRVL